MGGSTADTPASPEFLRASDAERDHAVSELRNEFAEGRLSHETFMYRMQSALDARNRGQLAGLFTDLPSRRPGPKAAGPDPGRPAGRGPGRADRRQEKNQVPTGTQRIIGSPYEPGPQALPWAAAPPGPGESRAAAVRRRGPGAARLPAGQRGPVHHRADPRLRPLPDRLVGVPDARPAGAPRGRLGAQRPGIAQRPGSTAGWSASPSRCRRATGWSSARWRSSSRAIPRRCPRRRRPPAATAPSTGLPGKGPEPARVGKRDDGSTGPARAYRDDWSALTGWTGHPAR